MNKLGNDAWNTPVTQWDRDTYADYSLLGSHDESVMFVREAIERGEHDNMPMLKMVAFVRERIQKESNQPREFSDIIGKTITEAEKMVKSRGIERIRATIVDGKVMMKTMDLNPHRLNVATDNGRISSVMRTG